MTARDAAPTMVDLFAGCGGLTTGFKAAGFRVVAAVEVDPVAAQTYRLNHPEVVLYQEDIRNLLPARIARDCDVHTGRLTVLSACAPCQPFSRIGRRDRNDERAPLALEPVRFAAELRPLFVCIENVPGLGRRRDILGRLVGGLERLGYRAYYGIVDAADYGVPQFRKRLVLLATAADVELRMPEPTHASPRDAVRLGKKKWVTVREAFEGLGSLRSGEASNIDPLHRSRKHTPLSLERLRHIRRNGGSRDSLPPELRVACHEGRRNVGYHDAYGRMSFDRPSNTLTSGCTNFTKGRFGHPTEDRSITLREAARLQTFPDSYRFHGTYEQISTQIGNAVPVKLAEALATYLRQVASLGGETRRGAA